MKYSVYVSTIMAYVTIHMMRMSLSFVQPDIIKFFNLKKSDIGVAMALVYIIMGIAYFIRAMIPLKKLQLTYFLTTTITAIFYSLTGFSHVFSISQPWILFVSFTLFGLFQTSTWPVLIKITHKYFHRNQDGFALGFWSSCGQFGNSIGFLSFTVIEFYLHLHWSANIFFSAFLTIVFATIILLLPIENAEQLEQNFDKQNHCSQFCDNFNKIFANPPLIFTFLLYCGIKSLIYGVLLWMPTYFADGGFGDFKGYISLTFSVFGILGSTAVGVIFEKIKKPMQKQSIFTIAQIVMALSFYFMRQVEFVPQNKLIFLFLIAIIGMTLVGNFNAINTHSATLIAEQHNINLGTLSSLFMSFGTTAVGVLEIIIGFAVHESSDSIFTIFFGISLTLLLLFIIRSILIWKQKDDRKLSSDDVSSQQSEDKQNQSDIK